MNKKPAVVFVVALVLSSLSSTSAFADGPGAPAGAPGRPARKPRKTGAARPAPAKKASPTTAAASAEPPAVAPVPAAPPPAAPAAAPAAPPAVRTEQQASKTNTARDEPNAARDVEASEEKPIALAPLLGYASEELKLGIGARASYTFPNRISVAGTFVYHFGTSRDGTSLGGVPASASVNAFYPGIEGGYELRFDRAVVRPYLGMAALFAHGSVKIGNEEKSDTKSHFALYPGVMAICDVPDTALFAGADARLLIVTDGGDPSFGFFGTFGVRL